MPEPLYTEHATVLDNLWLDPPPVAGSPSSIRCSYDGASTADKRFVAIYAIPSDFAAQNGDRYDALKGQFRQALYDAGQYFDDEADLGRETQVAMPAKVREAAQRPKVLCDAGTLEPTIYKVVLSKNSATVNKGLYGFLNGTNGSPFRAIKEDIKVKSNPHGQTFNKANEKYLVFYDAEAIDVDGSNARQYGQGDQCSQETASASNTCNTQTVLLTVDAAYAVDFADPFKNAPNWHTFLHEASHTMGAVHAGAPFNNSPAGNGAFAHCTDDEDLMCYDEDGALDATARCVAVLPPKALPPPGDPTNPSAMQRLGRYDCGQDSYFNADPAGTLPATGPDSYLRNNWNIAAGYNEFVYHGTTELVSRGSANANQSSYAPTISDGGRFVAFDSLATNLVGGDTNAVRDVFVRDRQTNTVTRASVGSGGQATAVSFDAQISADGRYVAFISDASNLVSGDTNGARDVFVRDLQSGTTSRVSVGSGGQANGASDQPSISAGGRYVAFRSTATNLVGGDTNAVADLFVRDLVSATTSRVSVTAGGGQSNGASDNPSVADDGSVAFDSAANNLVSGDTNNLTDVFARAGGTTVRGPRGVTPALSADGRYVAFASSASDLVAGDTNGLTDVFRWDRVANGTVRVSVASDGSQVTGSFVSSYYPPGISRDGRFVVFDHSGAGLAAGDTNDESDIFVRDLLRSTTTRVSVTWDGTQTDETTAATNITPAIGPDGRYVTFASVATLTRNDTSSYQDIFDHGVY